VSEIKEQENERKIKKRKNIKEKIKKRKIM
jgi:hypothetical protein